MNQAKSTDRTPRKNLLDPRLILGAVLVVASVVGAVVLVSSLDDTVAVYAAKSSISSGDLVTSDDLELVKVGIDERHALYLAEGDVAEEGFLATRPIAEGELVPRQSLSDSAADEYTSVVVASQGSLAASVKTGAHVAIWASAAEQNGAFAAPVTIIETAEVVAVIAEEGLMGSGTGQEVELLIKHSEVAVLLESLANSASIALVPVEIPIAADSGVNRPATTGR